MEQEQPTVKPKGEAIAVAPANEVQITRADLNKAVATADNELKKFIEATGAA